MYFPKGHATYHFISHSVKYLTMIAYVMPELYKLQVI